MNVMPFKRKVFSLHTKIYQLKSRKKIKKIGGGGGGVGWVVGLMPNSDTQNLLHDSDWRNLQLILSNY